MKVGIVNVTGYAGVELARLLFGSRLPSGVQVLGGIGQMIQADGIVREVLGR